MSDEIKTNAFGEIESEVLLPDGLEQGASLFSLGGGSELFDSPDGGTDETVEPTELQPESEQSTEPAPTTEQAPAVETPPTTEEPDNELGKIGGEEPDKLDADGQKQPETKSRTIKLKVNKKEFDFSLDNEDDLRETLQIGIAAKERAEKERRNAYRDTLQKLLADGENQYIAELAAEKAANGHSYEYTVGEDNSITLADPPTEGSTPEKEKNTPVAQTTPDFGTDLQVLKTLYPDFEAIPDEVAAMVINNPSVRVLDAYSRYREAKREQEQAKTVAALRKENEILKQNAAAAERAPVSGVSKGGAEDQRADPFLSGLTEHSI